MRLKMKDEFLLISLLVEGCGNMDSFLSQEAIIVLVEKLMNSFLLTFEEIARWRATTLRQRAVLLLLLL